jgi:hypothetical protein
VPHALLEVRERNVDYKQMMFDLSRGRLAIDRGTELPVLTATS